MDRIRSNHAPLDGDRMDVLAETNRVGARAIGSEVVGSDSLLDNDRSLDISLDRLLAKKYLALIAILLCGMAYVAFHLVRPALATEYQAFTLLPGFVEAIFRGSFPSFLLGIAMVSSIELVPSIRFTSSRQRARVIYSAIVAAAVWFEVIIPIWVPSSVGTLADSLAMLFGAIFLSWFLGSDLSSDIDAQADKSLENNRRIRQ